MGRSNAGLLGALIVYKRGAMPAAAPPLRTDAAGNAVVAAANATSAGAVLELPLLFNVMDENQSPFLEVRWSTPWGLGSSAARVSCLKGLRRIAGRWF